MLVVDRGSCGHHKNVLRTLLLWNVDEAKPEVNAVELYQKAIKYGIAYDIIIMSDFPPSSNGPDAVKELRELGFKGYIVCIIPNCKPENVNKYMIEGANNVLQTYLFPEYIFNLPGGPHDHPHYIYNLENVESVYKFPYFVTFSIFF